MTNINSLSDNLLLCLSHNWSGSLEYLSSLGAHFFLNDGLLNLLIDYGLSEFFSHDSLLLHLLSCRKSLLFMNYLLCLLLNHRLMKFMDKLLMLFMNNWLMDFSNLFLMDNWLMNFMNNGLMVLMNNVLMMLMNHILVMLNYHILMMLHYNWLISVHIDFWSFLMRFKQSLSSVTLDSWCLISSYDSCSLFISLLNDRLLACHKLLIELGCGLENQVMMVLA
jgi:hypothetical protein